MIIKSQSTLDPHAHLVIPRRERKTVYTLLRDDCRWPIGDPLHRDFHFCGKQKMPGFSYCEFHAGLSFQAKRPHYRPYGYER